MTTDNSKLMEVRNLSVQYAVKGGMLSAVNHVNFDIYRGEILALVGESGCGKSTTAFALARLLMEGTEEISGEVMFEGRNLLELAQKEMEKVRGREIGMIFQNPLDSLDPVYRCGKQVEEAIRLDGVSKEDAQKQTMELFESLKIPDAKERVNSYPHELSGGMRQRVMIAMMMARHPKLLIADEPTTALDVTIEKQILSIFLNLKKEFDTSVLVITHNFGIVAEIADRVCVLYAGDIVETADVFTLFKNPLHPYTRALMRTLPRQTKRDGLLEAIEGVVPRFIGTYDGCRFANRCEFCTEECKKKEPDFKEVSSGHFVKCNRTGENDGE